MSKVGTRTVRTVKRPFVCDNDRYMFIVAAKCYEKLNFVILVNKASCFRPA